MPLQHCRKLCFTPENTFRHEGCENVYNESNYEKGTDNAFFSHDLTVKGSIINIVLSVLDTDIELTEHDFLDAY